MRRQRPCSRRCRRPCRPRRRQRRRLCRAGSSTGRTCQSGRASRRRWSSCRRRGRCRCCYPLRHRHRRTARLGRLGMRRRCRRCRHRRRRHPGSRRFRPRLCPLGRKRRSVDQSGTGPPWCLSNRPRRCPVSRSSWSRCSRSLCCRSSSSLRSG